MEAVKGENKCANSIIVEMDSDLSDASLIQSFSLSSIYPTEILSWSVSAGDKVRRGAPLLTYSLVKATPTSHDGTECTKEEEVKILHLKSTLVGVVKEALYDTQVNIPPSAPVVTIESKCDHSVVAYDLCADCGLNLKQYSNNTSVIKQQLSSSGRISMIHGIPEIKISREEAEVLANKDKLRLLQNRKLALIVDLDQTLIHTSVDPKIEPGLPDVYGFKLPGHSIVYHCRLRPYARQFLQNVSKYYETHVFTMGTKLYAASVTNILDPDKKLFYGRIISRDDCFDPHSKALRLKSVFPCGDAMVAIIDDREDVWRRCPNLIHVKPYLFFAGTSDINAPPGSQTPPTTPSQASHTHHTSQQRPPHTDATPPSRPNISQETHLENQRNEMKGKTDEIYHNTEDDSTKSKTGRGSMPPSESTGLQLHPHAAKVELSIVDNTLTNKPPVSVSFSSVHPTSLGDESTTMNPVMEPVENGPDGDETGSSTSTSSDSDNSKDSSSSSSSSEIDDTLFDNLEREGDITTVIAPLNPVVVKELDCQKDSNIHESSVSVVLCPVTTHQNVRQECGQGDSDIKKADIAKDEVEKKATSNQLSNSEHLLLSPANSPSDSADTSDIKHPKIHDSDNFLLHLADILKQVHTVFYSEYDSMCMQSNGLYTPDLKQIIPKLRQSVLKSTKILFTGVIPTNVPPEKVPEWNTARAFGASIHERIVPGLTSSDPRKLMQATTHVISGKPGTSKFREAKRIPGMKIVNTKWLSACTEQWKLVDERLFPPDFEHREQAGIKPVPKVPRVDTQLVAKSERANQNRSIDSRVSLNTMEDSQDDVFSENVCNSSMTTNSAMFMKRKINDVQRHISIESHLSVSDEELEKMNAEVDAEIDGSTSSNEEIEMMVDELGSLIEQVDDDDSLSYNSFAGTSQSKTTGHLRAGQKRKHADIENSSSSNSLLDLLNESLEPSNEEGASDSEDEDSGDELAALLGET